MNPTNPTSKKSWLRETVNVLKFLRSFSKLNWSFIITWLFIFSIIGLTICGLAEYGNGVIGFLIIASVSGLFVVADIFYIDHKEKQKAMRHVNGRKTHLRKV